MKADPILQEVWDIKDRLAAEAGYDVRRFFEQLREWETTHSHLFQTGDRGEPEDEAVVLREEPPAKS